MIEKKLSQCCGFLTLLVVGFNAFSGSGAQETRVQETRIPPATPQEQPQEADEDLPLKDFRPAPMLKVRTTPLSSARFPVIDIHTHFGFRFKGSAEQLDAFVKTMDQHQIAVCVSLDATLGKSLDSHQQYLWSKYKDRFAIFVHLDWQGAGKDDEPANWDCNQPGFARDVATRLAEAKRQGAVGVKFFKQFGLGHKNPDGSLIKIDDRRWDPIWEACGELGLPVIIHTADPAAFFLPIDPKNERFEELARHPDWSFYGEEFPSRDDLLAARNRVIERFPGTKFIGAHMANNPEDLAVVGGWLEKYPNLYVEFASRIAELGRQPYTARDFFLKYQDRILFGTDGPWPELRISYYWRFLETKDEYFPYSEKEFPPQGLWRIYGIHLPDEVLKKIYFQNAIELVPALRAKYESAARAMESR